MGCLRVAQQFQVVKAADKAQRQQPISKKSYPVSEYPESDTTHDLEFDYHVACLAWFFAHQTGEKPTPTQKIYEYPGAEVLE